ncbi:MAG: hypothetical protein AB7P02_12540 [Alphaproteobacteria bacterium]
MQPHSLAHLDDAAIRRVLGFLGYGNPAGRFWFIGLEEGLGGVTPEEALVNLEARGTYDPVMDLEVAQSRLRKDGAFLDLEKRKSFSQVWVWIAKIVCACHGERDWESSETWKPYIQTRLGRSGGDTFLTEASPIPSKDGEGRKSWHELFRQREPTTDRLIAERLRDLARLRDAHRPERIVCYGTDRAGQFQRLLGIDRWHALTQDSKASADGRFLSLPFFGQGRMSAGELRALLDLGALPRLGGR